MGELQCPSTVPTRWHRQGHARLRVMWWLSLALVAVSLAVPSTAQVIDLTNDPNFEHALVRAFEPQEQVARSTARFLDIIPSVTPEQLQSIVVSNVNQANVIYGAALAFAPGAYDFVVNNITTGVRAPDGSYMRSPTRLSDGRALYCPYAFRGPGAKEGDPINSMDLAVAYDYTTPGTEWYYTPLGKFQSGEEDLNTGHWTAPYFDAGAGNISMVTFSVVISTRVNLTSVGSPHVNGRWFFGIATVDVSMENILIPTRWEHSQVELLLVGALSGLTALAHIGFIVFVCRFRTERVMIRTSPLFNLIILIGGFITSLSAVLYVVLPSDTNGVCQLRVAVPTLAVTTMLASLFMKTYRIARLFDNPKLKPINIPDKDLLRPTIMLILIQVVIVVLWLTIGSPPSLTQLRVESDKDYFLVPTCTENLIGLTASGVYTMGLIITGCYFSYRARKAPLAFNEASQILVVVTFMAFYAVVMVPLFYMIDDSNVTVRALMRSLPLLFGLWLMLVVLFGPKIVAVYRLIQARKHGRPSSSVSTSSIPTGNSRMRLQLANQSSSSRNKGSSKSAREVGAKVRSAQRSKAAGSSSATTTDSSAAMLSGTGHGRSVSASGTVDVSNPIIAQV